MVDVVMIETIMKIMESPWYIVMAALWGVGWYIKVQLPCLNKWIPTILVGVGFVLGYALIESTIIGAIAGFLMAIVAVGVHSGAKNTIELVNVNMDKE